MEEVRWVLRIATYLCLMKVRIQAFGIARDMVGGKEIVFPMEGKTVGDLRKMLSAQFPSLDKLNSLFIAVNHEYAEDTALLSETDEVALIPPVSGG